MPSLEYLSDMKKIREYNRNKFFNIKITPSEKQETRYSFEDMLNITNLPVEYFDYTFKSVVLNFTTHTITIERIL